jgi:medium-chain acyl-[acyl-carrier-protein] hydrolase
MTLQDSGRALSVNPWVRRTTICPPPPLRLICFTHAGGSATNFHPWVKALAPDIDVWAIELPGRGSRFGEPLLDNLQQASHLIADALSNDDLLDGPYAFFGHSMGGLIAYEVAQRLGHASNLKHFFASGCQAPQIKTDQHPMSNFTDVQFLDTVIKRYDGIPQELLEEPKLLKILLPILRADIRMVETYEHKKGIELNCPITVMSGNEDLRATPQLLSGWEQHTQHPFEIIEFDGGHFFLQSQVCTVLNQLRQTLSAYC